MKNIIALSSMILLTLLSKSSWACSICFYGSAKSTANIALRAGVLLLLIIVLGVLLAFTKFFLTVRKRSKFITQNQ